MRDSVSVLLRLRKFKVTSQQWNQEQLVGERRSRSSSLTIHLPLTWIIEYTVSRVFCQYSWNVIQQFCHWSAVWRCMPLPC